MISNIPGEPALLETFRTHPANAQKMELGRCYLGEFQRRASASLISFRYMHTKFGGHSSYRTGSTRLFHWNSELWMNLIEFYTLLFGFRKVLKTRAVIIRYRMTKRIWMCWNNLKIVNPCKVRKHVIWANVSYCVQARNHRCLDGIWDHLEPFQDDK